MLMWLLRGAYVAFLLGVATYAVAFFASDEVNQPWVGAAVGLAIVTLGGVVMYADLREREKQIATVSGVYVGLLLGLLLGWLFSLVVEPIIEGSFTGTRGQMLQLKLIWRAAITMICCYTTISTLLQTKDDFRFIIPYVEFAKQVKGGRPLVLDTSVIIDGRIADLCDTRVVDTKLIVPRFVLQELQGIADSSDKLKRNRGRRGLDILKRLQSNPRIELQMHEGSAGVVEKSGEKIRVDERLVLFAKAVGARVVTNDFNLNKIAQLQGVDVINLNEVANSLKTVALPGEYLIVKVVKPGDQYGQGVGYLDDGTMVVVEQGRNLIGQDTSLLVTSVLQTPAGRMIFGRPEARPSGSFSPVGGPSSGGFEPVRQSPPAVGPTSGSRPQLPSIPPAEEPPKA